jgi:hypothetical protein
MTGSFYLRIGRAAKPHMRLDFSPVAETPGLTGPYRVGGGFRSGFIGLALDPYGDRLKNTNILADFAVPISRSIDIRLAGRVGAGYQVTQYGAGAGIRVHAPKR